MLASELKPPASAGSFMSFHTEPCEPCRPLNARSNQGSWSTAPRLALVTRLA